MPHYPNKDLTNLYISESYENVLQLQGTELLDGLGDTVLDLITLTVASASFATTASYAMNGSSTNTNIFAITTITSSILLLNTYYTILCNAISGSLTITLPTASLNSGLYYNIKKIDNTNNTIIITGSLGEMIDDLGSSSISIPWTNLPIHCNGTQWYII